jgi:hypothetical protein
MGVLSVPSNAVYPEKGAEIMSETRAGQMWICVAAHAGHGYLWNPCKHWRWTPSDRLIYFAARFRLGAHQGCTKNWETKLSPFECAYPEKGAEIMTETHPGQVWTCEQHMQTADISGTPVNIGDGRHPTG